MIHQKQRCNASMVSEKSAASEESQGSDAREESVQEGRAMTMLLGVNAGAFDAFEKSVEGGGEPF